jgi:hypothetical protein
MGGHLLFDENGNVSGKLEFTAEAVDLLLSLELFPPGLNRLGFPKAWKSDS